MPKKFKKKVKKMIYAHDSKTLITIHSDGKIFLHNYNSAENNKEHSSLYLFSRENKLVQVAYLEDGCTIITAAIDGIIETFSNN